MRCLALLALAACAADADLDAAQDAVDPGKADAPAGSCARLRCGNPDATNILFPGNPVCPNGCERGLAAADLYIPPRNGAPWGDTYLLGAAPAETVAGYSSGRIALLRRLALIGDASHAVMLDPSWPDGARDFTGAGPEHGPDIVARWLAADPARTFLLVYSTRSAGWAEYAALATGDAGDRVKICHVDLPHLLVPTAPDLHAALVDPDGWDNGTCAWGSAP